MRFFDDILQMIRNRKFDFRIFSGEERYGRIRKRRFVFTGLILSLFNIWLVFIPITFFCYFIIKRLDNNYFKRSENTNTNNYNHQTYTEDNLNKMEISTVTVIGYNQWFLIGPRPVQIYFKGEFVSDIGKADEVKFDIKEDGEVLFKLGFFNKRKIFVRNEGKETIIKLSFNRMFLCSGNIQCSVSQKITKEHSPPPEVKYDGVDEKLQKYEDNIHDLKLRYQSKEDVARKIIKERFPPPQMTYDRFMNEINSWNTIFIKQSELALNIIDIAPGYTKKVEDELTKVVNTLESIVEKMEELAVELAINKKTDVGEVKELLIEMQQVIDSVKEYD